MVGEGPYPMIGRPAGFPAATRRILSKKCRKMSDRPPFTPSLDGASRSAIQAQLDIQRPGACQPPRASLVWTMHRILLVIIAVLLLAACGPRWTYTNLDWIIPWYVEDYIELDAHQDDELSVRLAYQLDWHCRTQLTRYAYFLRELRRDLSVPGQPVRAERWADHFDRLKQYWIDLIDQIGPDVVAIVVTASDEQIDTLFANIEKTNLDLEREYVEPSVETRRRNRQKRMQKRIEYWTGSLRGPQKALVSQWSQGLAETAEDWLAHRRRFQAALQRELEGRRPGPDYERRFLDLFAAPEKLRDPSYQEKIDFNKRLTFSLLENISRSLTPKQRRHVVKRLEELADAFERLACDPLPGGEQTGTRIFSDGRG